MFFPICKIKHLSDNLTEKETPQQVMTLYLNHYFCLRIGDIHFKGFMIFWMEIAIRGTSLGGVFVLEPWITPSLFYQFLGVSERYSGAEAINHTALDSLTFCRSLGGKEANRQLRIHWKHFVTEEQIANLAKIGVQSLRIPVADWMFVPYEPFTNGCWDGAIEELDRIIQLCLQYNISALLDLHALRGSQNGLDNSGNTGHYHWIVEKNTSNNATTNQTILKYSHWERRGGDWAGTYDEVHHNYSTIGSSRILSSLQVVNRMVDLYKDHPAVIGIQPVNVPSQAIPFPVLREYYWRSYQMVRMKAPHWLVLFHASFRLTPEYWGSHSEGRFMDGCINYAVDIHLYHAWVNDYPIDYFVKNACFDHHRLQEMEEVYGVPIIVGEWSLATDNCAMWLNGLNDNVPSYPKVKCSRIQCPDPYFPIGLIPNAPPDPSKPAQEPFGTGGPSFVEYGTCPVDRVYPNEVSDVQQFAYAQLFSYDRFTHGFYFWNFRTELETRWDYQRAVALGWIPSDWESDLTREMIDSACYSSPSPPPSSSIVRWLIAIAGVLLLLGSLLLLVAIFLPAMIRQFRVVRSGDVVIPGEDHVEIA